MVSFYFCFNKYVVWLFFWLVCFGFVFGWFRYRVVFDVLIFGMELGVDGGVFGEVEGDVG